VNTGLELWVLQKRNIISYRAERIARQEGLWFMQLRKRHTTHKEILFKNKIYFA